MGAASVKLLFVVSDEMAMKHFIFHRYYLIYPMRFWHMLSDSTSTAMERILSRSILIDGQFPSGAQGFFLQFSVPIDHPRSSVLSSYSYILGCVESILSNPVVQNRAYVAIVDNSLSANALVSCFTEPFLINSTEGVTKTKIFGDTLVTQIAQRKPNVIIAVGGGLLLNVAAYIAEQLQVDLIHVPTTPLAIADSTGGKVRLNYNEDVREKHRYKSFYEPNLFFVDLRFLDTVPLTVLRSGLAEVLKHGLFQSKKLLAFLEQNSTEILSKGPALTTCLLWCAALKHVCLEEDPAESRGGSYDILRAGHDISDRIEAESGFTVPHGYAVAVGICEQLAPNASEVERVFRLYGLPTNRAELIVANDSE